jgi:UDP-N-acetylglucosamine 4,6-dehydratase/5-epimerase
MEISGATILITGGTGSFGNRVATRLLGQNPKEIRIFSRDEKKQWEMQREYPQFRYVLGDVRDSDRVLTALRGVDIVFHAAALKQVPSCESYPFEAVKTNTIGSQNVCEAAIRSGVRVVVALSTDKAVKPVNAMGMSKAMMEKIVCSQNQFANETTFCCVRYGNVMGSRGSVIPLFQRMIELDEPLPLTVPHMTRFLMTLDQSVDLVLHAMTSSQGGEVFVRKAPACTVIDLARAMSQKYSRRKLDHPLKIVGIRPGEKIHEVLVNEYEMQRITDDGTFFTVHPEYRLPTITSQRAPGEEYTSEGAERVSSHEEIATLLDNMGRVEFYT